MVLHSFMLNPRNFLADCIRYGKMGIWSRGMPWSVINEVIDNDTFAYRPSDNAQKAFTAATGAPWDNLQESPYTVVKCDMCKTTLNINWTTCGDADLGISVAEILEKGQGYADAEFLVRCNCGLWINHDYLRSSKFVRDVQKVMVKGVPMPGGYLSTKGMLLRKQNKNLQLTLPQAYPDQATGWRRPTT